MNNRTTGGAGATTCSNRSSGSTVCNSRNALELRLQSNDGRRAQGPFVGSSDELAGEHPIAFLIKLQGPNYFFYRDMDAFQKYVGLTCHNLLTVKLKVNLTSGLVLS